jgi:hypothetical protein
VDYIKVKSHSGNAGNDLADDIAKSAVIRAESNQNRIVDTSKLSTHRLTFCPFFQSLSWDGHFRKCISTLMGFINNAEWSLNSHSRKWFDNDGHNTIPFNLANNIRSLDDINDFFVENNSSFIRWDLTWNLCRTLRHHNRFGPEFSRFNSFNIKCLNNYLPTIDNLRKRQPDLYDSTWLCHFCGNHEETLEHMFRCASIDWSPITNNVINATNNLTQRLNINSNLDFNRILSTPTAIQNADLPSPIASLAAGYMPSYIFAHLRNSEILHHSTTITTGMIKSTIQSFRQYVWKEQCLRQTNKEQQLDIIKSMKRTYIDNSRRPQSL